MPVQKQAGQWTMFKAFVTTGDYNGHVGLGIKCSKEVATVIILANYFIIPVQRGYTGNKTSKSHTIMCKERGLCDSVLLNPVPRGTGIISIPTSKKLLMMTNIDDYYTSVRDYTATLGNLAKATFDAISKTYSYLAPNLWKENVFTKSPHQKFPGHLVKPHTSVSVQRIQALVVVTT
ncbi:40S ribosomal protein S2 [Microtus ochrogaster]|uniref:Small ribosomal subunit protein uS5 n=1 Tax=Microtus ochrogaster TaxID=79684 RepID=A0A8J6GG60_MICOH|nr:40S ribosomal protein S2 [Microtus ochrogaster]